jgi:hypothetical protein
VAVVPFVTYSDVIISREAFGGLGFSPERRPAREAFAAAQLTPRLDGLRRCGGADTPILPTTQP